MLLEEEGLQVHKLDLEDFDDDQIKESPPIEDQNISRNSYVYANEDQDNDQYFKTGIYKK